MEFSGKLQQLRTAANLTQEQLAEKLFVSRVTISKWESGRGYPNIESLKLIAKVFNVSIDSLLSNEQIIDIAENQNKTSKKDICSLSFGLLDFIAALLFFLPIFGNKTAETEYIYSVNIFNLTYLSWYMKIAYFVIISAIVLFGVIQLALQNVQNKKWTKSKFIISMITSLSGILCFIISLQPYASVFLLILFAAKIVMLLKVSRM